MSMMRGPLTSTGRSISSLQMSADAASAPNTASPASPANSPQTQLSEQIKKEPLKNRRNASVSPFTNTKRLNGCTLNGAAAAAEPGTLVTSNPNKHAAVFQSDWHKWGQNVPHALHLPCLSAPRSSETASENTT